MAIVPKISGLLSWYGSFSILHDILLGRQNTRSSSSCTQLPRLNTKKRLLLALSIGDILLTTSFILSTWAIPSDAQYDYFVFNVGSRFTCNIQGFFQTNGMSVPLYNTCLCVYYLLRSKRNWTEERIARDAEPYFHRVAITLPLIFAVVPFYAEAYNPTPIGCSTARYPIFCQDNCVRGKNAGIFHLAMVCTYTLCFITIVWSLGMIYHSVREQRTKIIVNGQEVEAHKKILQESMFYVIPFLIVYIPIPLSMIWAFLGNESSFGLLLIIAILAPCQVRIIQISQYIFAFESYFSFTYSVVSLQGFFNAIVYFKSDIYQRIQRMCLRQPLPNSIVDEEVEPEGRDFEQAQEESQGQIDCQIDDESDLKLSKSRTYFKSSTKENSVVVIEPIETL